MQGFQCLPQAELSSGSINKRRQGGGGIRGTGDGTDQALRVLGYLYFMTPPLVGMIDRKTLDWRSFHRVQSQKPDRAGNLEEISYMVMR